MIWAVVAGVLVFGDAPDAITLLGMAVIAVSGLVVAVSGKDRKR
jgi:drug/metabolite transporter (DMT)-like permease